MKVASLSLHACALALSLWACGTAQAQTPASSAQVSGETMAHSCAACHGTYGRLGDVAFAPLAGMPVSQFVNSMIDFREGRRPATLMGHVAQGFNDTEIRAMAEFFAAVPPAKGDRP